MSMKTKCLLYLLGIGIIDVVVPVPILALIMIYVVLERPPWFRGVVREIYGD